MVVDKTGVDELGCYRLTRLYQNLFWAGDYLDPT